MAIFTKSYILAIFISFCIVATLFLVGFLVKNKYKYAKVLGSILIIHKIIEIFYLLFLEKFKIFTNFSLVINFILLISLLYLFTNHKLLFNISYHFLYIVILKILFIASKYKTPTYLYIVTLGYFLIILSILYGAFFLKQKVYFVGYIASIISVVVLIILSGMVNKSLHTNMMFTENYINSSLSFLKFNLYLIILMIANIVGISLMYIIKKN